METLSETINATRETTIINHYAAAKAEFEEQVKMEPLKTKFYIYAGCVSDDVTEEIAYRFNIGGVKATPVKAGFIARRHLLVECDLPKTLVREKPKEEIKEEEKPEIKEEEKPEIKEEEKSEIKEEEKPKEADSVEDAE